MVGEGKAAFGHGTHDICVRVTIKRVLAAKQGIRYDSKRPHVGLKPVAGSPFLAAG